MALTFDDLLTAAGAEPARTALRLREIVRGIMPDSSESVYGSARSPVALYGTPQGAVVCGIQPSGARCLFYLHRVGDDDVPELKLQGKGKHARQLAFENADVVPPEVIARLIRLSVERIGS